MRIDALTYAVVVPTLYAAHTLADHVVQTDHQAGSKADRKLSVWLPAMAGHVGGYQAVQALALTAVLPAAGLRPTWRGLLTGSILSAASHAFLDRRWPVVDLLVRTGSPRFAHPELPAREVLVAPASVRTVHGADGPREVERKPSNVRIPAQQLPIHGPYLADQALHTGFLAVAAALIAWRPTR